MRLSTEEGRKVPALFFAVNRAHRQYAGRLSLEDQLHHVRQGHGQSGSCVDGNRAEHRAALARVGYSRSSIGEARSRTASGWSRDAHIAQPHQSLPTRIMDPSGGRLWLRRSANSPPYRQGRATLAEDAPLYAIHNLRGQSAGRPRSMAPAFRLLFLILHHGPLGECRDAVSKCRPEIAGKPARFRFVTAQQMDMNLIGAKACSSEPHCRSAD